LPVSSWDYIKSKNLYKDKTVQCDPLLAAVFAKDMEEDKSLKLGKVIGLGGKEAKHLISLGGKEAKHLS
jgi:hypothetical protein